MEPIDERLVERVDQYFDLIFIDADKPGYPEYLNSHSSYRVAGRLSWPITSFAMAAFWMRHQAMRTHRESGPPMTRLPAILNSVPSGPSWHLTTRHPGCGALHRQATCVQASCENPCRRLIEGFLRGSPARRPSLASGSAFRPEAL